MRSTPEQDERLRARLEAAVGAFAGGSVDAMGRLLGYTNGGYLREILGTKKKPVRERILERFKQSTDPAIAAWFDGYFSEVTASDLAATAEKRAHPWPFRHLSPEEWSQIDPLDWAVAENAALNELDRLRQRGHGQSRSFSRPVEPSRKRRPAA